MKVEQMESVLWPKFEALCNPNRDFDKQALPRELPCRGGVYRLARKEAAQYAEDFPRVPCAATFWMICAWLAANPGRLPYAANMPAFLARWFAREDGKSEERILTGVWRLSHAS